MTQRKLCAGGGALGCWLSVGAGCPASLPVRDGGRWCDRSLYRTGSVMTILSMRGGIGGEEHILLKTVSSIARMSVPRMANKAVRTLLRVYHGIRDSVKTKGSPALGTWPESVLGVSKPYSTVW